ncbi:protein kinase [Chitinophaga sp. CF418]|uniref:serine/threonine protein kinase n=1 Tax=Chitinophaga sp. CF418 TaxID=1855287 RepID=UPI000923B261|nr:protein kinase [Chitinophaga sp. CF418]SHN45453.1 Protein kinase domain-containing protein [Chitinophaga sp. CF418]
MVDPEIKSVNRDVSLIDFGSVLRFHDFVFQQQGKWYRIGSGKESPYTIYLSTRILSAGPLLDRVLPLLWRHRVDFDVLKDNYTVSVFNGYGAGLENVGRFITIYCKSRSETKLILDDIERIVSGIYGPEVPGMLQVGRISYVSPLFYSNGEMKLRPKDTPGIIKRANHPRLIDWSYVLVKLLRRLPKGDTFRGINMHRFSCTPCLIKHGKRHAFDDFYGRDMIDRLEWQYRVLKEIAPLKISNRALDLIYKKESAYLVLEYLEGSSLRRKIYEEKRDCCWKDLSTQSRSHLLVIFLKILQTIQRLHNAGFLHRDLNVDNIIVAEDEKVFLIDLELAYTTRLQQSGPPFGQGIAGYISPQQRCYAVPDASDDLYSLGAVLVFMLTGKHPIETIKDDPAETAEILGQVTRSQSLTGLVIKAVDWSAEKRPSLETFSSLVTTEIASLQYNLPKP